MITALGPRSRSECRPEGPNGLDGGASIEVLDTDITTLAVDAIANAANTRLLHGGGVAGAIARAAGPALDAGSRARRLRSSWAPRWRPPRASMPSRWVIHAATMELGGPTSAAIIRDCTAATLACAESLGASSLALVAFGTGVGGFPLAEAARDRGRGGPAPPRVGSSRLERVVFAVRGAEAVAAFEAALAVSTSPAGSSSAGASRASTSAAGSARGPRRAASSAGPPTGTTARSRSSSRATPSAVAAVERAVGEGPSHARVDALTGEDAAVRDGLAGLRSVR